MKGSSSGRTATQKISKWSLKLIKFIKLLPCQRAIKAESPSQMKGSWAAKKTLKRATLIPVVWKSLDQLRHLEWAFSSPLIHLYAVQFLQVPSFCELSPTLGRLWWYSCFWVISVPVTNPSLIFLYVTPIKHNRTLVVWALWSVLGSLCRGETNFVTQHYLLGFITVKFYLFFVISKHIMCEKIFWRALKFL